MTKEKTGAMPAFFVIVVAEPFVVSLSNHERSPDASAVHPSTGSGRTAALHSGNGFRPSPE
jgi:hypothetical protein